jgi:serine/threonine-protein kinase RsbW
MDALHARLDAWEAAGVFEGCLGEFGRGVLRLALHEWVGNLVQHAAFGRRRPHVAVGVACTADGVRCLVEDNSDGFDFHRQLSHQEGVVAAPEPSERGRGLLMLIACTEDLAYRPGRGRQRLSFRVRDGEDAAELPPLFPLPD